MLLAADVTTAAESVGPMSDVDDGVPAYVAGDANRDGRFDQSDMVEVLRAGKYLSDEPASWSEGDWNGDNRFDQMDIVVALQFGDYVHGTFDAAEGKEVPLKGSGGSDVITDTLFGNASHLGAYTGSYEVSNFVVGEDSEGNPTYTFDQSGDVVGANGDSFHFEGSCMGPFLSPDLDGPIACAFEIDGGTGRFDGATGSFELTGVIDGATGIATVDWGGTISSVGSLKSG